MARPTDLLSVEEARDRILARFRRLEAEEVRLEDALGRVLAEDVGAGIDLPPFGNSSMDGFAVVSAATAQARHEQPAILQVTESIAAGSPRQRGIAGEQAARIMTGAPLPPGADAVIPFEEVEEQGDRIAIFAPVAVGACVRPAGNDVHAGETVLVKGTELGARQIALLAALGYATVAVTRRPVVAVLATGDELVAPGQPLAAGQIYNSNTPMLLAAVREDGGTPLGIAAAEDDPLAIAEGVAAAKNADLLLTSGGASVGDFDHVKDVVGAEGELAFWRVRVRPGKPLLFGVVGDLPVIGLPGNPTSAYVTYTEFVRPAVRSMLGAPPGLPEVEAVVDERIENHGGRRTYARVTLKYADGDFHARLAGRQDSAMLVPLADADGLLIIPEERAELTPGDRATVQVLRLPPTG